MLHLDLRRRDSRKEWLLHLDLRRRKLFSRHRLPKSPQLGLVIDRWSELFLAMYGMESYPIPLSCLQLLSSLPSIHVNNFVSRKREIHAPSYPSFLIPFDELMAVIQQGRDRDKDRNNNLSPRARGWRRREGSFRAKRSPLPS
jgi:hypothetical protein